MVALNVFFYLLLEIFPFSDVSNNYELRERTNDLQFFSMDFFNGLVVLPVVAILFLMFSHV